MNGRAMTVTERVIYGAIQRWNASDDDRPPGEATRTPSINEDTGGRDESDLTPLPPRGLALRRERSLRASSASGCGRTRERRGVGHRDGCDRAAEGAHPGPQSGGALHLRGPSGRDRLGSWLWRGGRGCVDVGLQLLLLAAAVHIHAGGLAELVRPARVRRDG